MVSVSPVPPPVILKVFADTPERLALYPDPLFSRDSAETTPPSLSTIPFGVVWIPAIPAAILLPTAISDAVAPVSILTFIFLGKVLIALFFRVGIKLLS